MITKKNGRVLMNISSVLAGAAFSGNLMAETVNPSIHQAGCFYGDCATAPTCTDFSDQQNLKELNAGGIVHEAILSPINYECQSYACGSTEDQAALERLKCDRFEKIAKLVLAQRQLNQ